MKSGEEIVAAGAPNKRAPSLKFTPETLNTLLEGLENGLSIKQACTAASISRTCYDRWRKEFPAFAEALEEAREKARQVALAGIKAAGNRGDWRALEVWLKMSFQADYNRNNNINVSATANVGQALVCDEPTRARLIELNQKLLKDSDHALPANREPNDTYDKTNPI